MPKDPPTPGPVVFQGWRDLAITGPMACPDCMGWGCRKVEVKLEDGDDCRLLHRTCPSCRGTGKVRAAS